MSTEHNEKHVYFFHWLDGRTSLVRGSSVQNAFRTLGYGGGADDAVDFYNQDKISHHFKQGQGWVPFEEKGGCFDLTPAMASEEIHRNFEDLLSRHLEVACVLPNENRIYLSRETSDFCGVGKVAYLTVYFAECVDGGWTDDDPNDHHYLACRALVFHLDQADAAIAAATQYALGNMRKDELFTAAASLEEIAERLDTGFSMKGV